MSHEERKEPDLTQGLPIKRKTLKLSQQALVKPHYLRPGQTLPLVIEPNLDGIALDLWAGSNLEFIEAQLLKHGAILFRNFDVNSIADFEKTVNSISSELIDYKEASTPRTKVAEKIYTSTEYPATQSIPLHNELSYSNTWPMRIWFFCARPANEGGETPIADSRAVLALLDEEVKQKFIQNNVMYVRNYGEGLGLPWQTVFKTSSRQEVESYCLSARIETEWRRGEQLRTRQVRPAVMAHPKTGEMVWFNQAHVHHVLSLDREVRDSILSLVEEPDYPLDINACYGDGSPIKAAELDEIHRAYRLATVTFPWKQKDILMLENMLAAHGRAPFSGERKIFVAMAEPWGGKAV
jgi:alpha-ketoglutarate-dependent taurine dioxygenase